MTTNDMKIKLNYVIATDTQKVFSVKHKDNDAHYNKLYIADTDALTSFNTPNTVENANGFQIMTDSETSRMTGFIHNLYDSNNVFFKSAIYNISKINRTDTSKDFVNITDSPTGSLSSGIQVNGTLYILKSPTVNSSLNFDVYQLLSEDNGLYEIEYTNTISTTIYNYDNIFNMLKSGEFETENAVSCNLLNVQYNKLYELPGNIKNDYQSSNIAVNQIKTKNQYNSLFNMAHNDINILKNCRDYILIDKCNNEIYLKYYDNIYYMKASNNTDVNNDIDVIKDVNNTEQNQTYNLTYQNIDVIKSINRQSKTSAHKSNVFSISINTSMINQLSNTVKENVINEIKNISRDIVENISPVDTQLFKIYVNGQ